MSGVANPPVIVEPFGASAGDPAYITLPIPVASQVGVLPGAASFEDGFPPLTMADPETAGGVPMFGQDMNGILYMLSAFCAMLQAGQCASFDAAAAAAFSGYKVGAVLARTGGGFWYNTVDGNSTDPEGMSPVGWLGWNPTGTEYVSSVVPTGTSTDFNAGGDFDASTRFLDLDASGGPATVNGFAAGYNGQTVTVSSIGSDNIDIGALAGSAGNQVRLPATLTLLPNMSFTMVYSEAAGLWIAN